MWRHIRPSKWVFLFILLTSLSWTLDATLWPYIFRVVLDVFTQYDHERQFAFEALKTPLLWATALWLTIEFGFRAQGFLLAKAMPKLEASIRMAMFDHVQYHSPKYFNEKFAGSLANKISDMASNVSIILKQVLTLFVPVIVASLIAIIFFGYVNLLFATLLGFWILLHFTVCFITLKKCEKLENIHGEARSELNGKIVDSLTNNFAVNLFFRFPFEKSFVGHYQKIEQDKNYKAKHYIEWVRVGFGQLTFWLGGVGINGYMIYAWLQGQITSGEVAQIFNTTWNITMMMWIATSEIPSVVQAIGIANQALSLMKDPKDILDSKKAKALTVSNGEIIFDNVTFHYDNKKLFKNKDVHIRPAEKVGLVGYSGAGKSTFVSLILRLYSPESGKILIDGQELSCITLQSLREQIALIPQDPILFHRSLKDNIRYGRLDATDDELYHAARLAHCDEFIRKLPSGYDTFVGERGTKLSGGERQRIAIARAFLAKTPILILDEATSALDSVTEKYIKDSLDVLMKNRTVLVIAHRLSTLEGMDRILVFDHGKIVEDGSHKELLLQDGHYAHMWQMQKGGFLPDAV